MRTALKESNSMTETLARVLVSSGDPGEMRDMAARLGACGYATLTAEPSTAALRLVREARPDLVVVSAEGDTGRAIALAEGVKQSRDTRHIPVAILARHAGPVFRRACLAAGIDDVIIGSVGDAVLAARLAPLFRLSTMTGELQRRHETIRALGLAAPAAALEPDDRMPSVLLMSKRGGDLEGGAIAEAMAGGCALSYVADAFSAAEVLTGAQFDALVLAPEQEMERTLHLCSHIRNNTRLFNLPVLLVADRSSFEDPALPYRRGASLVLTRPYDPGELRDQVQSLVRRQRLRQAVRHALVATLDEATGDAETGLYSRGFFAGHLSSLIGAAALLQKPLSVVLIEVQNLAWFEQQCGGGAGTRVMGQVARWIQGLVRVEDLPARADANSFAVALPDTAHDEALVVANRIAGVLLNTDFTLSEGADADPLRVWVEAGTAAAEPGDTVEGLLARARTRLR